eukprot:CAMPEP_0168579286 /NCGR_PEP_ID=MMETSP0420-20121227/126_1 /TAXON_ID=498008 /ORGANISM="Pessonella sp." /LENGTH=367 /DNA_ID=CAMNT_0008613213 /DNA_START=483 /DNA_END=1586 /DNA_ORIENTATION=-
MPCRLCCYRTFTQAYEETGSIETWETAGETMWSFVYVTLGSVFVGVAVACFSALFFKYSSIHLFPSLELSMLFILAYLPYLLASCFDLSGLMAVLFSGIVMSHYTNYNLSSSTHLSSSQLFRMIAFLGETCCFVILGIQSMALSGEYDFKMIFWGLMLCLLGRAVNVFPLAALVNRFRRTKIDLKMQFFMWFSGLRGAIAFALSFTIPTKAKSILFTTTMGIVLFTIFVFGGLTHPLLVLLQPKKETHSKESEESDDDMLETSYSHDDPYAISSKRLRNTASDVALSWLERFDQKYLVPLFRVQFSNSKNNSTSIGNARSLPLSHQNAANQHDSDEECQSGLVIEPIARGSSGPATNFSGRATYTVR